MLILWVTHWAAIVATFSWEEWVNGYDVYGVQMATVCGALVLRYFAVDKNNQRLLVWSRGYLAIAALVAVSLIETEEFLTLFRFICVAAFFVVAIWLAMDIDLKKGAPWWRGVVNPRHVVAMRRVMRKSGNVLASIPFFGATISAIVKGLRVVSKLKRDGSNINSGDLLLIVWALCLALFFSAYIDVYLLTDSFLQSLMISSEPTDETMMSIYLRDTINSSSRFILAGILLGIINVILRQPVFLLLAMVSFVMAPFMVSNIEYELAMPFWITCLVSALGVLSLREFGRD